MRRFRRKIKNPTHAAHEWGTHTLQTVDVRVIGQALADRIEKLSGVRRVRVWKLDGETKVSEKQ